MLSRLHTTDARRSRLLVVLLTVMLCWQSVAVPGCACAAAVSSEASVSECCGKCQAGLQRADREGCPLCREADQQQVCTCGDACHCEADTPEPAQPCLPPPTDRVVDLNGLASVLDVTFVASDLGRPRSSGTFDAPTLSPLERCCRLSRFIL